MNTILKPQFQELAMAAAQNSNWKPGLNNEHMAAYMQAFAQSIVQRCCEVIDAAKPAVDQVPPQVALNMAVKNIQAYFGVDQPQANCYNSNS